MFQPWLQSTNKHPFIVVGPEGCGKELLLRHSFNQLRSVQVAVVHCSAQTSAMHIIQKLSQVHEHACTFVHLHVQVRVHCTYLYMYMINYDMYTYRCTVVYINFTIYEMHIEHVHVCMTVLHQQFTIIFFLSRFYTYINLHVHVHAYPCCINHHLSLYNVCV